METIDISGLDKADVLMALYNASAPQGLGFLHARMVDMPRVEAEQYIKDHTRKRWDGKPECYFDYVCGRVMKVDIGGDELQPFLYDRDRGQGAALRALAPLIKAKEAQAPQ